jgi:hypothetical protein
LLLHTDQNIIWMASCVFVHWYWLDITHEKASSEIASSFVRDIHLIYAELFLGTLFGELLNVLTGCCLEHKKLQLCIVSQLKSVCCQVFCKAAFHKLCAAEPWNVG